MEPERRLSGRRQPLGVVDFWRDTRVNPASQSITVDIALFFLAAAVFMVIEARRHGIRFVWAYIAGGLLIAISVTFPLFLIARELKLGAADTPRLPVLDRALLAAFAAMTAAFVLMGGPRMTSRHFAGSAYTSAR